MKRIVIIAILLAPVMMRAQALDTVQVSEQLRMQSEAIRALNADLRDYARGQTIGYCVTAVGLGSLALSTMSGDPTNQRNLAILGGCLCIGGTLWCASNGVILRRHNVTIDSRGLVIGLEDPKKKK